MALEWGQARIEANALRDEILALRRAGQSIQKIYADMTASGRITLSLRGFYNHVHRLESEASGQSGAAAPSHPPKPAASPAPTASSSSVPAAAPPPQKPEPSSAIRELDRTPTQQRSASEQERVTAYLSGDAL